MSLSPLVEGLKRVENKFDQVLSGSDRLAAEQTIQRLKVEIPELERQVAVKEAQINAIIPRESLHRVANGMTQTGSVILALLLMVYIFSWAGLFSDSPRIEHYLQLITTNWLPILLIGLVCLFLGSILTRASRAKRSVRLNPMHPNAYEQRMKAGNDEVARLKAELETRKQQLEQLHQYTAQRNN